MYAFSKITKAQCTCSWTSVPVHSWSICWAHFILTNPINTHSGNLLRPPPKVQLNSTPWVEETRNTHISLSAVQLMFPSPMAVVFDLEQIQHEDCYASPISIEVWEYVYLLNPDLRQWKVCYLLSSHVVVHESKIVSDVTRLRQDSLLLF